MISTNNPDTENMLIVIQNLQPLSTSSSWKSWFNINLSYTSNLKISLHHASADKGLILLWLIESPH